MSNRDEFLMSTRRALCSRAGNKCSFPSCDAPTSGPSDESDESIDSTGMACHIYAAAPGKGAKRYDPDMKPEERRNAKNGIWMCYKHGKQIDNDECRFTSELLFKWKEVSERRAQIEHELGRVLAKDSRQLFHVGLPEHKIKIATANGSENALIGDALRDSCASSIWGDSLIGYVRDYLIERTRNAFRHGGATEVKIEISAKQIVLIDDGDKFDYLDLLKSNKARGGAASKKRLLEKYGGEIVSLTRRVDERNFTTFSLVADVESLVELTPCTIELRYDMESSPNFNLEIFESCSHIYVTLPKYFSTSDLHWLNTILPALDNDESRLVFVMSEVAEYIPEELARFYPTARVMSLSSR
jgi:hypothetical protein